MNKRYLAIVSFFAFISHTIVFGQDSRRDTVESSIVFQKMSLGMTLSALANVNSAFQINYGYAINERWRLKSEFGFVYTSVYANQSNGFRIKPGLHYMKSSGKNAAAIVGVNYNYRYTTGLLKETVLFPNESFAVNDRFIRRRSMHGIEAYFGGLIHADSRFFIELGAGLGAFYLHVNDVDRMPLEEGGMLFDIFPAGNYFLPMTSFHFSLNYVLGELR